MLSTAPGKSAGDGVEAFLGDVDQHEPSTGCRSCGDDGGAETACGSGDQDASTSERAHAAVFPVASIVGSSLAPSDW